MKPNLRHAKTLALVALALSVVSNTAKASRDLRYVFVMEKPVRSAANTYEDEFIRIYFPLTRVSFAFTLQNKTDNPLTLDWNQVAYVDAFSQSHKVMHGAVRYIERDRALPPSIIPPGASLTDVVLPVDYVSYVSGRYSRWVTEDMLPNPETGQRLVGKTIGIFIPLNPNGMVKNYNFVFSISTEVDPNTLRKDQLCAGLRHAAQVQLEFARGLQAEKDHPALPKFLSKASEQMAAAAVQMAADLERQSLENLVARLRATDLRPMIRQLLASLDKILDTPTLSSTMSATTVAKARETREAYNDVLKVYDDLIQ